MKQFMPRPKKAKVMKQFMREPEKKIVEATASTAKATASDAKRAIARRDQEEDYDPGPPPDSFEILWVGPPTLPPLHTATPLPAPKRPPSQLPPRKRPPATKERRYAESEEEVRISREFYDGFHLLGGERAHCEKYPRIFTYEQEHEMYRCGLCNQKFATQQHLNSKGHKYKFEYPWYYQHESHDDSVPLPRDPATRKKHSAEDAEPKIPPNAGPPHLWKQTILERRLALGRITMKEFKEQHPLGEDAEPRAMHRDQVFEFSEIIMIHNVKSYWNFNGAVAMVTHYSPKHRHYFLSCVGQFSGYEIYYICPANFETIKEEALQSLCREDAKLCKDIEGIVSGPEDRDQAYQ